MGLGWGFLFGSVITCQGEISQAIWMLSVTGLKAVSLSVPMSCVAMSGIENKHNLVLDILAIHQELGQNQQFLEVKLGTKRMVLKGLWEVARCYEMLFFFLLVKTAVHYHESIYCLYFLSILGHREAGANHRFRQEVGNTIICISENQSTQRKPTHSQGKPAKFTQRIQSATRFNPKKLPAARRQY